MRSPPSQFNLETPDSELFKDHLRMYRAVSTSPTPQPLELQVLLSVPDLTNNQVLVHLAHDSSRLRVDPTPRHIVLENWLLNFTPSSPEAPGDSDADSVAPSTIYKHGIPLFRSIYSLLRLLPSWKLYKKLRRRTSNAYRNGNLSIHLHVKGLDDGVSATDILDFGKSRYPSLPFGVISSH
jgi:autophagy-related protein 13